MKTKVLIFSALLLAKLANGQLSQNHFGTGPVKRAINVMAEPLGNPQGGQNLVWDFSNLNPIQEEQDMNYIPPSSQISSEFPGADLALFLKSDSIDAYFIINKEGGKFEQTGLKITSNGESLVTSFSNPKLMLPGSFNFGTSEEDEYQSNLDLNDFQINSKGNVKHIVDATGTITLPSGNTISNVIRVTSEDNYTDTVLLNIPGFPVEPEITISKVKIYNWYKNDGSGNPLVFSLTQDSTFAQGEWQVGVNAFYVSNTTTAVKPILGNQGLPFPNKVDNLLNIPIPNGEKGPQKIQIFYTSGRLAYEKDIEPNQISNQTITLSLSHLSSGIYYVSVIGNSEQVKSPFRIVKN